MYLFIAQNSGYGPPSPGQGYQSSPPPQPSYQPPGDKPPLPQGWLPLFDHHHQRWYYVEQATGRSQWEVPGYYNSPPPQTQMGANGYPPPTVPYSQGYDDQAGRDSGPKKSSGMGGVLLGAAGGAVGGALLGEALHHHHDSSSDDERRYSYDRPNEYEQTTVNNYYGNENGYEHEPPAVLPPTDEYGNRVSDSDRESVEDARERYEEALRDAESSSASSSDREEVEEAREEYYEEYEETYGGDDDYGGDDYDD